MIISFEHVGVRVRDVDASLGFYRDILGGEVVRSGIISGSGVRLEYVQIGQAIVELLGPHTDRLGYDHIAFDVEDIDAAYRDLSAAGFAFPVPPKTAGSGIGRIAFLEDPEGLRLELLAQPRPAKPVSELAMNPHLKSFDHVQVRVTDLGRARRFYQDRFDGRLIKDYGSMGEGTRFQFVQCGTIQERRPLIELTHHPDWKPGDSPRLGHIALVVDDVQAATEDLRDRGADVEFGTRPMTTAPARKSMLRDPDGNRVELIDRGDLRDM
jgi:catechol 2,3-dioxygenase-like lactoylglutathione lyase family enzyme